MEAGVWVVMLIVGLGLAVIIYGVVSDRAINARRRRVDRAIPGLADDAPSPDYLSRDQVLAENAVRQTDRTDHPTVHSTAPTPEQLSAIGAENILDTGWNDAGFVNHPDERWAVLGDPAILLSEDPVTDLREVLPLLESVRSVNRALVIGAPSFATEVEQLLALNAATAPGTLLTVSMTAAMLDQIAELTSAQPVSAAILQADAVRTQDLGHLRLWVSSETRTWLLTDPPAAG